MRKTHQELFFQKYDELLDLIRKNRFSSLRLPTEEKLADILSVSRITIRDILGAMEAKGFVNRKKGVGTLINKPAFDAQIRLDINQFFPDEIRRAGFSARVMLNSMDYIIPNEIVCSHLQIDANEKVMCIEKMFFADDKPFIYLNNYLSQDCIDYALMKGIELPTVGRIDNYESSKHSIKAVFPPPFIAEKLSIPNDTPVLHVLVDGYNQEGKPIMFSEQYFLNGVIDFTVFQRITPENNNVALYYDSKEDSINQ